MLIEASHLQGIPVATLDTESAVGMIDGTLIHPRTGEVVGFWVKPAGWFAARRALSARDVVGYEERGIVIRTADVLVSPDDVQPFKAVYAQRDRWQGKKVESEDGDVLGTVADVVVDTDLERVAKLHVNKLFGPERVISRDEIVKVTPKRIVVLKSTEPKAAAAAVPEAA